MKYDPAKRVDPLWWRSLGDTERLSLVEAFHVVPESWHSPVPDSHAHAVMHVVVENLVARGDETPLHAAFARLLRQGLWRHEAIHALAIALADHMRLVGGGRTSQHELPPSDLMRQAVSLTAAAWRAQTTGSSANRAQRRSSSRGGQRPTKARASDRKKKKGKKR